MEQKSCTFDLTDKRSVVQHIRDLLNLAELLERGFEEELQLFIKKLKEVGWGSEMINSMITLAGYGTKYEFMTDNYGKPLVPRAIPEAGDQKEWKRLKTRMKK